MSQVTIMPHCEPVGNFQNVAQVFNITLAEFSLLWACRRDDVTLYGLNPCHVNKSDRELLCSLRDRGFIWLANPLGYTGKWELTEYGLSVVDTAPLLAHTVFCYRRTKGEVVPFPVRKVGNSA